MQASNAFIDITKSFPYYQGRLETNLDDLTWVRAEVVDISIPLYLSTSLPPLTAHIHHHTATR